MMTLDSEVLTPCTHLSCLTLGGWFLLHQVEFSIMIVIFKVLSFLRIFLPIFIPTVFIHKSSHCMSFRNRETTQCNQSTKKCNVEEPGGHNYVEMNGVRRGRIEVKENQ